MVEIEGNFIGLFKLGDNIQYNLALLRLLYSYLDTETSENQKLLYKPIVVTIVSIIEAILHDFASRIRNHTRERSAKVSALLSSLLCRVENDKFAFYIDQVRQHDELRDPSKRIYDELDDLRKLRNRVHIQNTDGHQPYDEDCAFTRPQKIKAEELLEKIMKFMHDNHSRPPHAQFHQSFELPWTAHYP